MIGRLRLHGVGEKMTRRLVAVALVGEAFAFFFGALVAFGLNRDSHGPVVLAVGLVLAVVCFFASGTLRKPWGITLGWILQVALVGWALVVPAMIIVAVVFVALWITALFQGHKMDELTARHLAGEEAGSGPASPRPEQKGSA